MASASDDFNRTDGTLGANWTDAVAGIVVNANRAYQGTFTTHAISYYTGITWADDQSSQITVTDATKFHGVGVRVTGSQGYFFLGGSGSNAALFEFPAGTLSEVQAFACQFVNGDLIKISVTGSSVVLTQNGTTVYSTTRTTYPTGGSPAMHIYDGSGTLDDWAGADIGGGGGGGSAISMLPLLGAG